MPLSRVESHLNGPVYEAFLKSRENEQKTQVAIVTAQNNMIKALNNLGRLR